MVLNGEGANKRSVSKLLCYVIIDLVRVVARRVMVVNGAWCVDKWPCVVERKPIVYGVEDKVVVCMTSGN